MNTMWEPSQLLERSRRSASSAAARPTSGRAPAPRPWVMLRAELDARGRRMDCCERLRVGVGDDELDALEAWTRIMLLTALPPAPPTPITVMRGLSSLRVAGQLRD